MGVEVLNHLVELGRVDGCFDPSHAVSTWTQRREDAREANFGEMITEKG